MMCEAERRNKQALYLLENEWGCGRINVTEMQKLLRGPECDCKGGPNVQPEEHIQREQREREREARNG